MKSALKYADLLSAKASQDEFDAYREDAEYISRLYINEINRLKLEIEQLKKYIYQQEVKLWAAALFYYPDPHSASPHSSASCRSPLPGSASLAA